MRKILYLFLISLALNGFISSKAYAINIARDIECLGRTTRALYRDVIYTPPPGGFVNNDETEFNAIIWNDPVLEFSPLSWLSVVDNDSYCGEWQSEYFDPIKSVPAIKTKVDSLPTGSALTASLAGKENTVTAGTSGQYYRGDKTWQTLNKAAVGLGNVDNTADLSKPISTATQTALNGKFNTPSGSTSQYVRGDGSLATLPVAGAFTVGTPNNRTMSLATAYQCTDASKPCAFTITVGCPYTLSLLTGATCAGEVRIGSANTVATGASGTAIAPIQRSASGILGLATNDYETKTINVPAGWYLAVRQPSGTGLTIQSAYDQSLSVQ